MVSTVRNMWKVIHDRKCGAIVMLSDLVENGIVYVLCTCMCSNFSFRQFYRRAATNTGLLLTSQLSLVSTRWT